MQNPSPPKDFRFFSLAGRALRIGAGSRAGKSQKSLLMTAWFLAIFAPPIWAAPGFHIAQRTGTDLIQVSTPKQGPHKLEIDDASGFRTPVVTRTFSSSGLEFHANDAGLIAGIDYHVRLAGGPDTHDLR